MTAALAHGTFAGSVPFTVTRLDPAVLPPEPGQDSTGGAATIDPLAAYQFNFAIPTLGQNATLTFEINLAALSPADRAAFLAALAAGNATVAVKNDAPGSVFHAFAIAAPGQPPDATHVTITQPDANHVVFQGVTGHFSTFAVVTVSGSTSNTPPVVTSLAGPTLAVRGQSLHYTGSFTDPDADTWTATVNFGDGSGDQPVTLNPDKTFALDHVFANTGNYTVVVTVADNHGGMRHPLPRGQHLQHRPGIRPRPSEQTTLVMSAAHRGRTRSPSFGLDRAKRYRAAERDACPGSTIRRTRSKCTARPAMMRSDCAGGSPRRPACSAETGTTRSSAAARGRRFLRRERDRRPVSALAGTIALDGAAGNDVFMDGGLGNDTRPGRERDSSMCSSAATATMRWPTPTVS